MSESGEFSQSELEELSELSSSDSESETEDEVEEKPAQIRNDFKDDDKERSVIKEMIEKPAAYFIDREPETKVNNCIDREPETKVENYKGVTSYGKNSFKASICHGGKNHIIGKFKTPLDAAKAYDNAARRLNENSSKQKSVNFPTSNEILAKPSPMKPKKRKFSVIELMKDIRGCASKLTDKVIAVKIILDEETKVDETNLNNIKKKLSFAKDNTSELSKMLQLANESVAAADRKLT